MTAKRETVAGKAKGVLGSLRFWIITAGAAIEGAAALGKITPEMAHVLAAWLAAVTAVRTVDKFRQK